MVNDAGSGTPVEEGAPIPLCPWCSATRPAADAASCPSCQARLLEETALEIPGVTAVDPALLAAGAAPRKVKRTLASLLVGSDDDEIPPPSEAEMPALARPAADVRREMLRIELEARLASLKAEIAAREAEDVPDGVAEPVRSDASEASATPIEPASDRS